MPLYALYALLFEDTGLSQAQISLLFVLWSATAFVAEVPSGALADRYSRRRCLVASSLFQALGFALWITLPGFVAFAAGFVLWGFGGSLVTGAYESLLYEGLVERQAEEHYARVNGWVGALALISQIPAAGAATLLFSLGGYNLVGWASMGVCLAAAALATRLPEPARAGAPSAPPDRASPSRQGPLPAPLPQSGPAGHGVNPAVSIAESAPDPHGYLTLLRIGIREAVSNPVVRTALIAAALIGGLDGLEEYFPLMAKDWGVPTALIPVAILGLPLAGAAGAAFGGRAGRITGGTLGSILFGALVLLGAMALVALPAGLAGVAVFYALHQMILVVVDARLQATIEGSARATITSVASLGTELVAIALFAAWAAQGLLLVAGIWLVVAVALPYCLRTRLR